MNYTTAPVWEYCSRSLFHVGPEVQSTEVLRWLKDWGFSSVPVLCDGKLEGIVSLTDLARARCVAAPGFSSEQQEVVCRTVADVMMRRVVTVDIADSIAKAAGNILERNIHRVIVTKDKAPVAVLSTRDLMKAVRDARIDRRLDTVMTPEVVTINVGASIHAAVEALAEENIRGLVVVDRGHPIGAFTNLEAAYARMLYPTARRQTVESIMSFETIWLDRQTPLFQVAAHALATGARRILVLEGGMLVGIATGIDLTRALLD